MSAGRANTNTICRFRAEHEEARERLFVPALRLCGQAGLVKLRVGLEGSKLKNIPGMAMAGR